MAIKGEEHFPLYTYIQNFENSFSETNGQNFDRNVR